MQALVSGLLTVGCAVFGGWLIANRDRLDEAGKLKPNTYVSAGYRAFIVIGVAVVSLVIFVTSIVWR